MKLKYYMVFVRLMAWKTSFALGSQQVKKKKNT